MFSNIIVVLPILVVARIKNVLLIVIFCDTFFCITTNNLLLAKITCATKTLSLNNEFLVVLMDQTMLIGKQEQLFFLSPLTVRPRRLLTQGRHIP